MHVEHPEILVLHTLIQETHQRKYVQDEDEK